MAINELGISAPISNADAQDDTRAIILRNYYETARNEVLKSFDWNFAETYRILTPNGEESLDPRFQYVYDYPNDCLNARELLQQNGDNKKKKFKPSSNLKGQKVLLANVSPAILRYTRRVEQEAFFDDEDNDDDFDFFEEESESERNYVQLNPGTEKTEEKAEKPESKEEVVEEFFDEEDDDEGEAETTSLEDEEA